MGLPIVLLICNDWTFCQFFLRRETRKLIPRQRERHLWLRDSKFHTHHDVGKDLVVSHLDMSNGNAQAKDLLELELNRRSDFIELVC
jgi:hypothetical protein